MSTKILYNHNTAYAKYSDTRANKVLGFWIYLMSDCILFATLFTTYGVLSNSVAVEPKGKDIYELPFILMETFFLLFSSTTYSMSILAMYRGDKKWVNIWLGLTFLFGLSFICMELCEFYHLVNEGYGPDRTAFLSSFFTLVGTHGLHVISGLIWIIVMMVQVFYRGITEINQTRLQCLGLFWHFLDVIWVCVFTVVYLMGVLL